MDHTQLYNDIDLSNRNSKVGLGFSRIAFAIVLAITMPSVALGFPLAQDSESGIQASPTVVGGTNNASVTALSAVSVSGAGYDERRDDTTAKIVVTRDDLTRFGDATLADSLKRLPGVTVEVGAPGKSGAISLRGMGNGYTQILLNGQKVPPGFDIESIAPEMVERIEIVRAATADMRTEAIAGTINIILRKSTNSANRSVKLSAAESRGLYTPSISWQVSNNGDQLSYAMNASASRRNFLITEATLDAGANAFGVTDLYRPGTTRTRGTKDTISLSPTVTYKLANGDKFSVETFIDSSDLSSTTEAHSRTLIGTEQEHPDDYQHGEFKSTQARADLGWTHGFEDAGQLETKLTLNWNQIKGDFHEHANDGSGDLNLDDRVVSQIQGHGFNTTGKYTLPYVENHQLEVGWDGGVNYRHEERTQSGLVVAGVDPENSHLAFQAEIARLGLYAQDDWSISPLWSLYYGLRVEQLNTRSSGSDFGSVRSKGRVLSPIAQLLWKLRNSKDQIRVAFSRTYNAPPIASLIPRPYTTTNNTPMNPDTMGNPSLRPELAVGLDAAFEHYWSDSAMISVGPYVRKVTGVIRDEVQFVDGRWVQYPFNGGNATAWGVEMDTHFTLDQIISNAPKVNVHLNATRNWSDVEQVPGPNNRIDDQIRFSSTLSADYRVNPLWDFGSSYTFNTGGSVRVAANQIDGRAPKRALDLYALWSLSKATSLRMSLSNLLRQDFVRSTEFYFAEGTMKNVARRPSQVTVRADLEIKY